MRETTVGTRGERPLLEVGAYFLRLGVIAFGGPAAHIALMRRELVQQRKWVTDAEFVDMLGVTNLIPGPNSTELTMHMGSVRAGWWGLWLGGAAFIAPAVAIVLAFAWAYVKYGDTPAGEGILLGVQPLILAVIIQAIWGLRTAVIKGPLTLAVFAGSAALALVGVYEVWIILGAGAVVMAIRLAGGDWRPSITRRMRGLALAGPVASPLPFFATHAPGYSVLELFLVFLKIGAVLYGSGYVLVSFLQADLVESRGWLTEQQLLDAIAVGQFTPGPVFSAATFAGYVVDGLPGAAVATLGIFLPSFCFVALTHPLLPRLRRSPWASGFLDGVNASAVALMAVVTFELSQKALDDVFGWALFVIGAFVLVRFSPNSAWIILAGAVLGIAYNFVT